MSLVHTARSFARGEYEADFESRVHDIAAGVSTDRLSRMELQLLPVVASALAAVLPDHPATSIAEGAKRRAAAEAMLAENAASIAASALSDHGLMVAPVKGLALNTRYEALGWRRPMGDADLLSLQDASWDEIRDAVTSVGFQPGPISNHAHNYDLPDGRRADIHRFVSPANSFPAAMVGVIPDLLETGTTSSPMRELMPEFHMAHAIEHAMRWNPIPPARSISDIAAIQESSSVLDWPVVHRLLRQWCADRTGLALINALVERELLPETAIDRDPVHLPISDRWLQNLATSDPRESWIGQPVSYFGLIPWRLNRHDSSFSYREYLRALWNLGDGESLTSGTWIRISRRRRYGRNLPQYTQE